MKVAAAPQVSLPASINGKLCAHAAGAATSAANANSNIIGRRGMPFSFYDAACPGNRRATGSPAHNMARKAIAAPILAGGSGRQDRRRSL